MSSHLEKSRTDDIQLTKNSFFNFVELLPKMQQHFYVLALLLLLVDQFNLIKDHFHQRRKRLTVACCLKGLFNTFASLIQ